jgi:hypothetical protein
MINKATLAAAVKAGYLLVKRPDNAESRLYGTYYWHPPHNVSQIPPGDTIVSDPEVIEAHKRIFD